MKRANKPVLVDPLVRYDCEVEDLLPEITAVGSYVEDMKSERRAKRRKGR
jgi:hypothetical protein